MKRPLFYLLLLLSYNFTNIIAIENNQKKSALYNSYFAIKEYSKFCINYRYYTDQEKVEKAKIVCKQCDYIVGYRHLCCHYIFEIEETKLKNTIEQMKNASNEELSSFLLNSYEQSEIACDQCKEYHGWQIETSDQNIQNEKEIAQIERAKQKIYGAVFIMKEFCKAILHAPFLDHQKIKDASISCCKAHHKNDASLLWVKLFFKFDEAQINELKNHIYKDSTEELASFILKKSQEIELDCRECGEYSGYYIPEQSVPQD